MASKLFKPAQLPPLPSPKRRPRIRPPKLPRDPVDREDGSMLFGVDHFQRAGEFYAKLYDAQTRFQANLGSKKWRLRYDMDRYDRVQRYPFRVTKQFGHWVDSGADRNVLAGEPFEEESRRIPMGSSGYLDINVQFFQMGGRQQNVKIPKPTQLITDTTNPLGPVYYSTIQNGVETGQVNGFYRTPPQSHYMDPGKLSLSINAHSKDVIERQLSLDQGNWIEPDRQVFLGSPGDFGYWNQSSTLRARLKPGVSHIHMWCPSGEYCEFDTSDLEYFKVTQQPYFEAPDVSLVIKSGWEIGTHWELYLVPRLTQITAEWWDYYFAITPFSFFEFGLHNIRTSVTRLPSFPVPYGYLVGQFSDDIGLSSDWVYYVSRWHGPFSPGIAQAHPRPVGFEEAGGEGNFDPAKLTGGIWEGPPVHGADYAVEYAVKHNILLTHNPHDFETFALPFFAIIYSNSGAVSYFARQAFQQPGQLCAKVKAKGRLWKGDAEGTFYIWQRKLKLDGSIQRTMNVGFMAYNWDDTDGDFWTLTSALALGGW